MRSSEEGTQPKQDAEVRPASLGDFIASQRRAAEMSLRQLAERAGISNPYVSQIERGLRKPSAEVLQQLAKALQVSAGTLFSYAGLIDPDSDPRPTSVPGAIGCDPFLSVSQKQALTEVYLAFTSGSAHPSSHHPFQQPSQQPEEPASDKE